MNSRLTRKCSANYFCYQLRLIYSHSKPCEMKEPDIRPKTILHCYKTIHPWKNLEDFSQHIISSVVYNQDGLIAINKPYGIQVYSHNKPEIRPGIQQHTYSYTSECNYSIEDVLPIMKEHLNISSLSILKSAERFSSGIMLLSSCNEVSAKVKKSFNIAKHQKRLPFIHWLITLGYPVVPFRTEKVGVKFIEINTEVKRQAVIETKFSKRDSKLKKVHPVQVEYRVLSQNIGLPTSLVEMASSSINWYFARLYASDRISVILGDFIYGSRMSTLLGVPIKVHLQNSLAYNPQVLPREISEKLNLPKGTSNSLCVPTMAHLRSIVLPSYKDKDLIITSEPPTYFNWTLQKLNLLNV